MSDTIQHHRDESIRKLMKVIALRTEREDEIERLEAEIRFHQQRMTQLKAPEQVMSVDQVRASLGRGEQVSKPGAA